MKALNINILKNLKEKTKLIIILSVEFIAIILVILLIFFAGKKSHTVTFDMNGGILISGELVQRVTQGQNATPPTVAKHGHYLLRWSGSYKSITQNVTLKAIWEYETSPGIHYYVPENANYCLVSGSISEIQGEVFIGSYYEERQVMGIEAGAFKDRTGITAVHLLDGILAIEEEAFSGCTSLNSIDIPSTVVRIGKNAFKGCTDLKELVLPDSLKIIEDGAFSGCSSIRSVDFPINLSTVGDYAFNDCSSLERVRLYGSYIEKLESNDKNPAANVNKPDEEIPVEKPALLSIGHYAFNGCSSLMDVIITRQVVEIGAGAFTTPTMTIRLCFDEDELPQGYHDDWCIPNVVLEFNYEPVVEEEEETDKEQSGGFWGDGI